MEALSLPLVLSICRVGGCLLIMPGLSSARVPIQARLLASIGIAVAVSAFVQTSEIKVQDWSDLLRLVASELFIGLFLGLVGRLFLLSLGFMATAIGTVIGFGNIAGAGIEDGEPHAALGTLITMSAVLMLFQFNFHHSVIEALVMSYSITVPLEPIDSGFSLEHMTGVLSSGFFVVLQLASPFIAYALIANLAIGLVNKLAPQIPVYFVSLPFLIAGGLWFLYLAMPVLLTRFAELFLQFYR